MDNCIFCAIAEHKIPSEIVYEDDLVVAFKDVKPIAPTHLLIIPKEHFRDFLEFSQSPRRAEISEALMHAIKTICEEQEIESFHILNNCGEAHGQSVFHLHFHLISGVDLTKHISF